MTDPIFVLIGGGKGGIGKSTFTFLFGSTLSKIGFSVGFVDTNPGGADLHDFVDDKRPACGLQDIFSGRVKSFDDIVCETAIPNTWLYYIGYIPFASEFNTSIRKGMVLVKKNTVRRSGARSRRNDFH